MCMKTKKEMNKNDKLHWLASYPRVHHLHHLLYEAGNEIVFSGSCYLIDQFCLLASLPSLLLLRFYNATPLTLEA